MPIGTTSESAMSSNEFIAKLQPTIMMAISDVDFLLNIPIESKNGILRLSYSFLSQLTGVHVDLIKEFNKQGHFIQIYEAFTKLEVIRPNFNGFACNRIRLLERAKRYIVAHREVLSQVSILNGRISVAAFERLPFSKQLGINGFSASIHQNDKDGQVSECYTAFLSWVFEQIVSDGHFDKNSFVSYTDKAKQRTKFVKGQSVSAIFMVAREFEGYTDSIDSLGSVENFNALMVLFALSSKRVSAISSVQNYLSTFVVVKKFLEASNICHSSPLDTYLNQYISDRFRAYIEDVLLGKTLSPLQASTYMSCLNLALERLSAFKEFNDKSFIYAPGFDTGSSSQKATAYTPYTSEERNIIQAKLDENIEMLKSSWLSPYVKSDKEHDFIKFRGDRKVVVSENVTLESLKSWFDNECNSIPFYFNEYKNSNPDDPRNTFKKALTCLKNRNEYDGDISSLWELWHVPGRILTARELIPLFLKLIQVTGMNPSSVIDLEIDDFVVSHDATNRPCLRYWKERSTGGKEYHLDIFKCDITWLSLGQAKSIRDIFDITLAMTEHVRSNAPDGIKNKLFIFNNTGRNKGDNTEWHEPCGLGLKQIGLLLKEFSNGLTNEIGENVDVIATRFRSSFVSELVDNGVPLREIQMIMGHASITTTIAYLDRMDFNNLARQKIFAALTQIYENSYTLTSKPESQTINVNNLQEVIYKTPLGGCKNIFDPPSYMQAMKGYTKGSACSNFNKCLSCSNVIITKSHLPDLFALYRDYLQVTRNTGLMGTPHGKVVQENIDILECILGERSEFSASELEVAKRLSFNIESTILIDGVSL